MSKAKVAELAYVEFDPWAGDEEVKLDVRARFILGPDGRVRCFTRTENFRDYVLPDLIGGGLPDPATGGAVTFGDGEKYLAYLRNLINNGGGLVVSDLKEMDEQAARDGFAFEYVE